MYVDAEFDIKKKELYSIGLKKINKNPTVTLTLSLMLPRNGWFLGNNININGHLTMMLETTILKICTNDIETTTKLFSFILDTTVPARKGSLDSNQSNWI